MHRTYVKAEDLGFIGSKFIYGEFFKAMQDLLSNIIIPEFKSISTDFYLDEVTDVHDHILLQCRINVSNKEITLKNEVEYDSINFLKDFLKLYNQAIVNISDKMSPVHEKDLNNAGLSEDQFIVNLISLNIYPNVKIFNAPGQLPDLTEEILIDLILNMEEISELRPGGLGMLYLKYKNLCMNHSRYNTNELKEWIQDLGYNLSSKEEMCHMIKTHYDF